MSSAVVEVERERFWRKNPDSASEYRATFVPAS